MIADLIKTGLIGRGIQASRSPSIHTKEAAALGLRLTYSLLDLDEPVFAGVSVEEVLAQAEADGFAGVNVTYPFKQAIIPLLNDLSEDAQRLGAVNTVVFGVEGRVGHNTDWFGFAEGFRRGLPGAALNRAVQLGAGGAGSAIAYALLDMGVQHLVIFDIDTDRALDLVLSMQALFGEGRVSVGADKREAMALADTMVVMNHGVIVQTGSPHEIYNRPVNEFVARFMGGHNVIETPAGKIGVRTDHIALALAQPSDEPGAHAQLALVSDVEYQGTYVLLGLQSPGAAHTAHSTAQWSVMLSEAVFGAQPLQVGDTVRMSWLPEAEHVLTD